MSVIWVVAVSSRPKAFGVHGVVDLQVGLDRAGDGAKWPRVVGKHAVAGFVHIDMELVVFVVESADVQADLGRGLDTVAQFEGVQGFGVQVVVAPNSGLGANGETGNKAFLFGVAKGGQV